MNLQGEGECKGIGATSLPLLDTAYRQSHWLQLIEHEPVVICSEAALIKQKVINLVGEIELTVNCQ